MKKPKSVLSFILSLSLLCALFPSSTNTHVVSAASLSEKTFVSEICTRSYKTFSGTPGTAQLVGVPASGHNHSTWLTNSPSYLLSCSGVTSTNTHTMTPTVNDIRNYLNTNSNNVFISRSHGGILDSGGSQIGTGIYLNDTGLCFRSDTSMSGLSLYNLSLVMFVACKTGAGGTSGANLPHMAVTKGADAAIGFSGNINCNKANSWTTDFCYLMKCGYSIQSACSLLISSSYSYNGYGLQTYVICGNSGLQLN